MDEQNFKLNGRNLDEGSRQNLDEFKENEWAGALAHNVDTLQKAMQTPFLFVVAVNPTDGSFEYFVKSSKPRVSEILMKHFGAVWNEKIVPEVNETEPKIVTNKGPLIIIPGER